MTGVGSGEGFGPPREEGSLFPRKDRKGTREGVQLRGAKSADEMGLVDPMDFDPEAELSLTPIEKRKTLCPR